MLQYFIRQSRPGFTLTKHDSDFGIADTVWCTYWNIPGDGAWDVESNDTNHIWPFIGDLICFARDRDFLPLFLVVYQDGFDSGEPLLCEITLPLPSPKAPDESELQAR